MKTQSLTFDYLCTSMKKVFFILAFSLLGAFSGNAQDVSKTFNCDSLDQANYLSCIAQGHSISHCIGRLTHDVNCNTLKLEVIEFTRLGTAPYPDTQIISLRGFPAKIEAVAHYDNISNNIFSIGKSINGNQHCVNTKTGLSLIRWNSLIYVDQGGPSVGVGTAVNYQMGRFDIIWTKIGVVAPEIDVRLYIWYD